MSESSKTPHRLSKSELFGDAPVYMCDTAFPDVCSADVQLSQLYSHDVPEISMVVSGSGYHVILGQAVPCRVGDVYIIASDVPHGYFRSDTSEELTVRRLLFDVGDWFDGDIADKDDPRYCYGVFNDSLITAYAMPSAQSRERIYDLFTSIGLEASEQGLEWRDAVRAHLTLLLITIGRYVNGAVKNIITERSKEWNIVSSALRMVDSDFMDCSLTLGSIADSLYVSKSHLSRLFKRLTGESFSDHLRNVRIDHAASLLRETDMTVEEIVVHCGLRDVPTFYKTFGELKHTTPGKYRGGDVSNDETINVSNEQDNAVSEIAESLQNGNYRSIRELIQNALDSGYDARDILENGLLAGMDAVGIKFKNNEAFVPEVLVSARAFNIGMQVIKPYFAADNIKPLGHICIGTVEGDLHDIGKNLVRMMLEGKGFEVIDLGTDVSPKRFIEEAVRNDCRLICCSALLSTTMPVMRDIALELDRQGLHGRIKLMIGGAPVTEEYRCEIGADFYTSDAASAADTAERYFKDIEQQ